MRSGRVGLRCAAVALGLLRAASGGASEALRVRDAIDGPSFMARHDLTVWYASTGGGRLLALCAVAGGRTNRLEFTTRATGGFETFQRQEARTMDLSNPGIWEFALRPADGKAPVINLENLRLQPVPAGPRSDLLGAPFR